jgi:putative hydrolase of the HAD superfamily
MHSSDNIQTLFLDIGGVLLTNGWDRHARRRAAETFGLDFEQMDDRHHLTFDSYERGWLTLDEYLCRTVFFADRSFSPDDFKRYMFAQSEPYPEMIELMKALKQRYDLRVAAISNEGRDLMLHRIRTFELDAWIDVFLASCFLGYRKPDTMIYRMAIDLTQAKNQAACYIDDRALFVQVARDRGLPGIHHKDPESTRAALADRGLRI